MIFSIYTKLLLSFLFKLFILMISNQNSNNSMLKPGCMTIYFVSICFYQLMYYPSSNKEQHIFRYHMKIIFSYGSYNSKEQTDDP